jgi:hypothetical protein
LLFLEITNRRVTLIAKIIICKPEDNMTKVHTSICVLTWQESEVWCLVVSFILGWNAPDKFKPGERTLLVKRADRMCRIHLPAVSHSRGKLRLLLYPSLAVMELHNRAASTRREIYYSRQINKHRL